MTTKQHFKNLKKNLKTGKWYIYYTGKGNDFMLIRVIRVSVSRMSIIADGLSALGFKLENAECMKENILWTTGLKEATPEEIKRYYDCTKLDDGSERIYNF